MLQRDPGNAEAIGNIAGIAGINSPRGQAARQLLERSQAARPTDPRLAVVIMSAFAHTNPTLLQRLTETGASPEMAAFGLMANQAYALGLSAVRELGIPLHTYDNYIPVRWIYNSLVRSLGR